MAKKSSTMTTALLALTVSISGNPITLPENPLRAVLSPADAAEYDPDSKTTRSEKQGHSPQQDNRTLVPFPDETKSFFLQTMRQNLSDISQIHRALAGSDFEEAARIAELNLGMGGIETHDMLAVHMPEGMRNMGIAFHKASSQLALSLQEKDIRKILGHLANVTQVCVTCHSMYRVQ